MTFVALRARLHVPRLCGQARTAWVRSRRPGRGSVRFNQRRRPRPMSRMHRMLISVILVVTLTFAVCTVRPQPVHADDTTTILIVLGGVIGGLMVIALIFT